MGYTVFSQMDEDGAQAAGLSLSEAFARMMALAAALHMPEGSARLLAEDHLRVVSKMQNDSDEQREDFAREQTAMMNVALGENAEALLKEASAILSRVSGRTLDLAKIVKTNGANVAARLLFHADDLKATGQA